MLFPIVPKVLPQYMFCVVQIYFTRQKFNSALCLLSSHTAAILYYWCQGFKIPNSPQSSDISVMYVKKSVKRTDSSSNKALDPGFSCFSSVLSVKFNIVTSSRAVHFLPNAFQFSIHQTLYCSRDEIILILTIRSGMDRQTDTSGSFIRFRKEKSVLD
jgi:hypothetical protein